MRRFQATAAVALATCSWTRIGGLAASITLVSIRLHSILASQLGRRWSTCLNALEPELDVTVEESES